MDMDLPENVRLGIIELAIKYKLDRVILFGSRARGDNKPRSDIDLAVKGGNIAAFAADVDEEIPTLLMFDVVDLDKPVQPELLAEIAKDGIELYRGEYDAAHSL